MGLLFLNLKNGQNLPDLITSSKNGVPVKRIDIDMNASDFFGLFKQLSVTLSVNGGLMEGKDIVVV